jgi:hypothetical protein
MNLELKGVSWVRCVNASVVNVKMILKAMGMDEIVQEKQKG